MRLEDLRSSIKEWVAEGRQLSVSVFVAIDADHDNGFHLMVGEEACESLIYLPLSLCAGAVQRSKSQVPSNRYRTE